jgi:putative two-component system response regulator
MHLVELHPGREIGVPAGIVDLVARLAAHHTPTYDHSFAVAGLARALAWELGIDAAPREEIVLAGLVHDIGKLSIDETLLDSARALAPIERERVVGHTSRGARLLRRRGAYDLAAIVEPLRERFDGTGPRNVRGIAIPLATRIVAVANAYEGLRTGRPYRAGLQAQAALADIAARSGTWFDPKVVAALDRRERGYGTRMPFLRSR